MPYTIKKTNGETIVVIPDGAIDEGSTSLNLVGKNVSGYGIYQNKNFIYLLENFSNPTPPEEPITGQIWYDSTNKQLKVYTKYQSGVDGQTNPIYSYFWKGVSNNTVSASAPPTADAVLGDLWYNTDSKQLHVFNGTIFELTGTSVPGFGKSRLEGAVIEGIPHGGGPTTNYPVLNLFLDNVLLAIISKSGFTPTTPIAGLHTNTATPNEVVTGINLLGNTLINGRADVAHTLMDPVDGPLHTDSFVRSDLLSDQHVDSVLHVRDDLQAGLYGSSLNPVVTIGNYHGPNGDEGLDAQIKTAGNKLIFTAYTSTGVKDIIEINGNTGGVSPRINITPVADAQVDIGSDTLPFRNVRANNFIGDVSANDITASGTIAGNLNASSLRVDSIYTRNGLTKIVDAAVTPARFSGRFVGLHEGQFDGTSLILSGNANISGGVTAGSLTITGGGSAAGMIITGAEISNSSISNSIISGSTIASPTMTGTPVAPTAPIATNNQQVATTAFVHNILPYGVIMMWSGSASNVPNGWLLCDGQTISGVTTPNLTNRFILGAGGSGPVPNTTGGSFTITGTTASGGSHSHTGTVGGTALTVEQLPPHSHPFSDIYGGVDDAGSGIDAFSNFDYDNDTAALRISANTANTGSGQTHTHSLSLDGESAHTHTLTLSNARPPYYALCYIMKAV